MLLEVIHWEWILPTHSKSCLTCAWYSRMSSNSSPRIRWLPSSRELRISPAYQSFLRNYSSTLSQTYCHAPILHAWTLSISLINKNNSPCYIAGLHRKAPLQSSSSSKCVEWPMPLMIQPVFISRCKRKPTSMTSSRMRSIRSNLCCSKWTREWDRISQVHWRGWVNMSTIRA